MEDAYRALSRYVLNPILDRFHVPHEDQEYMKSFYINGLMAVISEWLKNDCKDSVEHIVTVIQTCIANHRQS